MSDDIKKSWTQSFSGQQFFPFDMERNKFLVADIAHSLALVNRFNGHTKVPYSVAQHSVYVSLECDHKDAFWGLVHDSSESAVGDLISPIKKFMPAYVEVENSVMASICNRFKLSPDMPASVKKADLTVLAAESRDLFPVKPADWNLPYPPSTELIVPMSWREAEQLWLQRFVVLWPGHMASVEEQLLEEGLKTTVRAKVIRETRTIEKEAEVALREALK